ncbi:MAG: AAA family ATPase [Pigmentiphaga sp.]|nr:AAA family ATPase [Pigmentiphaga sp.]
MHLTRLQLRQVRRFGTGVLLDDLQPGLNLLHGPNESGKTTLVRALRAVFFERYGTTAMADLAPWGDSGASPEIEVDFRWQGQSWRLAKRFLKGKRCDLTIDGEAWSGEHAEARVASLLGYEYAGKGASSARHWGVPGLLWIEQGGTGELREAAEFASPHLRAALGPDLGGLASGAGDTILARVEALRAELLTATGKPRGEYAQALAQLQERQAQREPLAASIREYQDDVDRLAELDRQQRQEREQQPWRTLREQQGQAAAQLADVAQWQARLAQKEQDRELQHSQLALLRQQRADQNRRREERARRQQAVADSQQRVAELTAALREHDAALENARRAYDQARQRLRLARRAADRRRDREALELRREQADALRRRLAEALRLQDECLALRQRLQAVTLTPDSLKTLRQLARERERLTIQREQAATHLHFVLPGGQDLEIDGERVAGNGERQLLHRTRLRLPGGGELHITPGGTDLAELERRWARCQDDWRTHCQALGLAESTALAEADARQAQATQWSASLAQLQASLAHQAPDGVAAIEFALQALEAELARRQEALAEVGEQTEAGEPASTPHPGPAANLGTGLLDLSEAETAEALAEARLKRIERDRQSAHTALASAQNSRQQAQREWEHLQSTSPAADDPQAEADLRRRIDDAESRLAALQADILAQQARIQAARPEVLQQDVDRLGRSADHLETRFRTRELQLAEQRSRLQTLSAEGLEERRAELERDTAHWQRRCDELERRAAALDLLRDRLRAGRQALTQRLQEPLRRHLEHYLTLLFPGAGVVLDDNLVPTRLNRPAAGGPELGDIDALSFGAREQLGLISRLAYADLLREAGHPTLIVLDDALVHTDHERLDRMKRVLFDAAQRHQVLLLTCHPQVWQDLGVAPRDIAGLPRPAEG